jgi:hypothetical protein
MTDDDLAAALDGWAKSALTRDLYSGAAPLSETLRQAAKRIRERGAEVRAARTPCPSP